MISNGVKMDGREQDKSGADEGRWKKKDRRRNWPKMKGENRRTGRARNR